MAIRAIRQGLERAWRGVSVRKGSLGGRLLALTIVFVLASSLLIYFPTASNFRNNWLGERANAAHLAAIAAELAGNNLSEDAVRELLAGADAMAVARITGGATELILGADTGDAPLLDEDQTRPRPVRNMLAVIGTFTGPPDRLIVLTAIPQTRPDERILVILPEAPLREALIGFSARVFRFSLFTSLVTGSLIYLALLFLFVGPMRRLSHSMTQFQENPSDARRVLAPSLRSDEIGEAERALAAMQADILSAIRQRERLASLGLAVAKINHDLRNVFASAQLVSDRLATSEDARTAAMGQRLVRAIGRGIRLCSDVLDYGKTGEAPGELRAVALRPLMEEIAAELTSGAEGLVWQNTLPEGLTVLGDRDSLYRLFANLIRNAVTAMKDADPARLSVEAVEAGSVITVRLTDTGPGIPKRVRTRLFEPFSSGGGQGSTGLGLSIARELAVMMDGSIELVSTGREGSVFEVTLKRAG
ncbi:MAG: sensor histidine kinase [Caulobacterales bacterium]|uniref:sensor histidine kinase n=1 Tax=Glycocaulis sp. TaxID=1969725 RepID=UPI003F9F384A